MITYKKSNTLILTGTLMFVIAGVSCTKNFSTINTPWNGSPTANVQQLYDGFVTNLQQGDNQVTYNSWTYPITQQGVVYTKADYSYGNDGNEDWSSFYHNLSNYVSLMNVIAAAKDTAEYTNVKAMMKTLKAYQAIKLSNFYGDMPYSDAGKVIEYGTNNYTPAYDKQQSIYLACLADLTWAVNNFSATDATQYSLGTADVILLNNIPQWIEFANSLRLRIALTMYDKDAADATPIITDALSKPLLDADNTNVGLWPANIPNLPSLAARKYSFGTECRLRMGTTMWHLMSSNDNQDGSGIFDPRCNVYFEPNNAGQWNPFPQNPTASTPAEHGDPYNTLRDADWANKDGNPATTNLYANFNYYWARDVNIPELFMTTAEVHFLKAEIYTRGIAGVAANATTAQTEYNAGITASVNFWIGQAIASSVWTVDKPSGLPSSATLATLETSPQVLYDISNPTHALQQVYAQEWIDMFRQPWDAWTLQKRTGLTPTDSTNATYYTNTYGSYNRYQYPGSEQTYNYKNWYAETAGNDLVSTKIWIAK